MMIVDKILECARGRGYAAVYGSAGQVNEMLTDVDFAASKDATAVFMHLVTDSATVDGKDTAVVAVYFASLCDFDFDGESLLPEQERLKGTDTIWNPTKGKLIPESGVTKVTRTWSTNRRGPMNMKNCMIQSDNIYFAYLGMKIGWDT